MKGRAKERKESTIEEQKRGRNGKGKQEKGYKRNGKDGKGLRSPDLGKGREAPAICDTFYTTTSKVFQEEGGGFLKLLLLTITNQFMYAYGINFFCQYYTLSQDFAMTKHNSTT